MKKSDIDQIYQKMTSIEKATLMFNATLNDKEACDRILNNVPQYTYKMLDKEFSQTLDGIYDVTSFWAIEYWKNLCGVLSSFPRLPKQENNLDVEKLNERDDHSQLYRSRIVALLHIMDALSDKHGIEKESVLGITQAKNIFDVSIALDDLPKPAQDYYHATLNLMDSMISGDQVKDRTLNYFSLE